ncbi:hypothetical protein ACOME3_002340 [Neoechinorhynchus agilis]
MLHLRTYLIFKRVVKARRLILCVAVTILFFFHLSHYLKGSLRRKNPGGIPQNGVDSHLQSIDGKDLQKPFIADIKWLQNFNDQYPVTASQLTFGIEITSKQLSATLNKLKWQLGSVHSELKCKDTDDIGGIIINVNSTKLYILNFKKQGDYLYVCNMNLSSKRWFGDVARTVDIFKLKPVKTIFGIVNVPANTEQFIRDYNTSKFLECNKTLQKKLFDLYPDQRHNVNRVNEKILPGIVAIKKQMKSLGKNFFLAGGTLLGWYRQCGIIEQSLDVDFAMMDYDYDISVLRSFLGNKDIWIIYKFGHSSMPGHELRFTNGKYTFDLFIVYKDSKNDTLHCIYQLGTDHYVRSISPIRELCSCDLLGIRLQVTCQPVEYIENEYGRYPRWFHPKTENVWTNLRFDQKFNTTFALCQYLERFDARGNRTPYTIREKDGKIVKC